MRQAAVEALGGLEHAALAAHADAIVQDSSGAGWDDDGIGTIHVAALRVLAKLEATALEAHAETIVAC